MIKAIAYDTNPAVLLQVTEMLGKTEGVTLVKTFTSLPEAIKYAQKFPVDFCILEMNATANIEQFLKINQRVRLLITSESRNFAVDAFDLNAIDYLLKPLSEVRFTEAIQRVKFNFEQKSKTDYTDDHFYIRADYSLVKVFFKDILYIEGLDDYLKINLTTGKIIVARCTLKALSEKLRAKNFIRVHRSFIIPLQRISSVQKRRIAIENNIIPIGDRYVESFFNAFQMPASASA